MCLTLVLQVYIFGHGTRWDPWFLLVIIPHSLNMLVHSPLSLRYGIKQLSSSWIETIWGVMFAHGAGYCLLGLCLIGFLCNAVNLPFDSMTWTSLGLFVVVSYAALLHAIRLLYEGCSCDGIHYLTGQGWHIIAGMGVARCTRQLHDTQYCTITCTSACISPFPTMSSSTAGSTVGHRGPRHQLWPNSGSSREHSNLHPCGQCQ